MRVMPYPDELSTTTGPMEWIVTQDLYDIIAIVKHVGFAPSYIDFNNDEHGYLKSISGRRREFETSEAGTRFFFISQAAIRSASPCVATIRTQTRPKING